MRGRCYPPLLSGKYSGWAEALNDKAQHTTRGTSAVPRSWAGQHGNRWVWTDTIHPVINSNTGFNLFGQKSFVYSHKAHGDIHQSHLHIPKRKQEAYVPSACTSKAFGLYLQSFGHELSTTLNAGNSAQLIPLPCCAWTFRFLLRMYCVELLPSPSPLWKWKSHHKQPCPRDKTGNQRLLQGAGSNWGPPGTPQSLAALVLHSGSQFQEGLLQGWPLAPCSATASGCRTPGWGLSTSSLKLYFKKKKIKISQ